MTEACENMHSKRAHTRPDWKTAARLLAGGATAKTAAEAVGIPEERLWRHWRRSGRFRRWLNLAFESQRDLAAMRLEGAAREALLTRCQAPDGLPVNAQLLTLLSAGRICPPQRPRAAEIRKAEEEVQYAQRTLEGWATLFEIKDEEIADLKKALKAAGSGGVERAITGQNGT